MEQCIGCMTEIANVRLINRCESLDELGPEAACGNCLCRPMWCLSCLARWYASRLIHKGIPPTEWFLNRVSCPTCRTVFCVRDVVRIKL